LLHQPDRADAAILRTDCPGKFETSSPIQVLYRYFTAFSALLQKPLFKRIPACQECSYIPSLFVLLNKRVSYIGIRSSFLRIHIPSYEE